jgi:hypothetical protein
VEQDRPVAGQPHPAELVVLDGTVAHRERLQRAGELEAVAGTVAHHDVAYLGRLADALDGDPGAALRIGGAIAVDAQIGQLGALPAPLAGGPGFVLDDDAVGPVDQVELRADRQVRGRGAVHPDAAAQDHRPVHRDAPGGQQQDRRPPLSDGIENGLIECGPVL